MYQVFEIVNYVLWYGNSKGYSINNLKLQMLLYLIQREFLTQKKQKCFGCRFEKEYHVPVLQPVYRMFRKYGINPIPEQKENYGKYILEVDKELINSVVDRYAMSTNSTISKYVEMLNRIDNRPSTS